MKRAKILITIDWFLPGTASGGPVRSYTNLIEHLKDDFEFYIITRNTDYGSNTPYQNIIPNTWTPFNAYTKIYYISTTELNKSHLKQIINTVQFDIAYINGIYSWYFSILPILLLKKMQKPIIVSARGMLNPQAFSVKGKKKKVFLTLSKILGFYNKVSFHATNRDEALHIKNKINKKANVTIAPNLPRKVQHQFQHKTTKQEPVRFVNIARISVEKGTLTLLEVLKFIKQPLVLHLYGAIHDLSYWKACETIISQLPKYIEVVYKGVVPSEDVPKTLRQYDYFTMLSEGENFGHAILEAFSAGLPVLISNRTPWTKLEAQGLGWDVDISNQNDIIKVFNKALEISDAVYSSWSKASINYAKDFINNPKVLEQNKVLFLNAIKNQ